MIFKSLEESLKDYRETKKIYDTNKIKFYGDEVLGKDVYNISHSFKVNNDNYILGRVETTDSEISQVLLFKQVNDWEYECVKDFKIDMYQDPYFTYIDDSLMIAGTRIYQDDFGMINNWNTSFYLGKDFNSLEEVIKAPKKMKDVRIIKQNDTYHVFTRPQGGIAGPGKIGYFNTKNFDEINETTIENAKLLMDLFPEKTWGGVNQVYVLKNGLLGIVGHIAKMSEGDVRHYYGMVFVFDPKTFTYSNCEIICERQDFVPGAAKRVDLIDVVFLGGLTRNNDGTATLYTGISDKEAHYMIINDPFIKYEEDL